MGPGQDGAALAGPVLFLAFLGWLSWGLYQRRRRRHDREPVLDEAEGTPYRVYTRDADRVVTARDAGVIMAAEDRRAQVGPVRNVASWPERAIGAQRWAAANRSLYDEVADRLRPFLGRSRGELAVLLLVDHSGSMKDQMIAVAATMRWLSLLFDQCAVPLAIAGFSTVGWRGGVARRQWVADKRPKRPGRLCATLHLLYRDFDKPMEDEDWRVMADPAMLRENIDGEAIEWAAARLASRPERTKVMIVVSDGAPVDDSTLISNGPDFLVRHARKVIDEVQNVGIVKLGAIGIHYRVDAYYRSSVSIDDLTTLPSALAKEIIALADEQPTR